MRIKRYFRLEWSRTSTRGKWFLSTWGGLMVSFLVWGLTGTENQPSDRLKDDVLLLVAWCFLVAFKWWIPFAFGAAVRKRGGSFGNWALFSIMLGWFIPGIIYIVRYKDQPVLPEFLDQQETGAPPLFLI